MGTIKQPDNLVEYNIEGSRHPKSVLVNNWRYIKSDYLQGKSEVGKGCYILVGCNLYFVPGVVGEQVMDIADSPSVLDTLEAFFFQLKHGSVWCTRCQGAGKLNWIDNAKGGVPYQFNNQHYKEFKRNRDILMVYSRRTSHRNTEKTLFLAPSIVERGEIRCLDCRGTGLWLNATIHLFQGFPKIRSKIIYEKGDPYGNHDRTIATTITTTTT